MTQEQDGITWAGWLLRATGLAGGTVAFVLALALVVGLAGGPVARNATASVHVDVILPAVSGLTALRERSIVYAADGSELAILHDEVYRSLVPLDEVPDHVWQAVLTAEDRRFFEHEGYDVPGIGRALLANARARGIAQGGSTITQQLAKSAVGAEPTLERKVNELLYAVALEEQYGKEELLEQYLNQVYFGSGAYGIAAAADEYFGVGVRDLRVEQAALLAGLIRSPGTLDPRRNHDVALRRRNLVLRGMAEEGYLRRAAADVLAGLPLGVMPAREPVNRAPYIVEQVKREFFSNPAFGETLSDRIGLLFGGGLEIHTTLDPRLQRIADEVVADHYPDPDGVTASIAAVDPRNGAILAVHSGRDFTTEQFDLAILGRRQPGSAFKPFVLATALELGFPMSMQLEGTSGTRFDVPEAGAEWRERGVRNYGNSSFGRVDMRQATVRSINTAFAQLILLVGVDRVVEMTQRLGVDMERATNGHHTPSMALGGLDQGISPLEMASAYGTFANGGRHVPPHIIDRVLDRRGKVLYRANGRGEQVLEPWVNATMVEALTAVVTGGTGTRARLRGWQVAGKTGTTSSNTDVWFTGFTPVMSTAVWVGYPEARTRLGRATGGTVSAVIWRDFMTRALEGVEPVPYPDRDADRTRAVTGEEVEVPDLRQLDEYAAVRALVDLRLVPDLRRVDSLAPRGRIVWQQPRPGSKAKVGEAVRVGVSTGKPPPPPEPDCPEGTAPTEEGECVTPDPQPADQPPDQPPPPEPAPPPPPPPGPPPEEEEEEEPPAPSP